MEKLTTEKVEQIAEELRTTKVRATGHLAFDYIWEKYKDLFVCYEQFVRCMDICSVFFSCRKDVEKIREHTEYTYI